MKDQNQSFIDEIYDTEGYRDSIATVDEKGRRIWVYPKKQDGFFYKMRTYVSWVLLAILFGLPWIKINGEPLVLLNILELNFIIFGVHFTPQDFHLFVIAMITFVVFIALFTAVFGRLFCGWVCPQTIFMEMVYRKIEYWIEGDANAQRRLNKAPWTADKFRKKLLKQAIFFAIAVLVANTFLAYIIGIDEVLKIASEPISQNLRGFIAMLLFSGAFYFVFSWLREQVCIAICPYGRMQGVLLDRDSITVAYDWVRGEPRTKIKKGQEQGDAGDCIDCKMCVKVCPTGIDIRNGIQLECVNCTACIDACDEIMEKVGRPKKLIRYDSLNGIQAGGKKKLFNNRVVAYSVVLLALVGLEVFLFSIRSDVETLLLRTPGMLFQETDDGYVSNLYNYQIINKVSDTLAIDFRLIDKEGRIRLVGESPIAPGNKVTEGAMFIDLPKESVQGRKNSIKVGVYSEDELIETVTTNFFGPFE